MNNKKAKAADKTSVSAQLPVSKRMVQNVLLVWLDSNIDQENSDDCRNTVTQLRRVVNAIHTFTNADECFEFMEAINNEKACMIFSGSLAQQIVPCVHDMPQVDLIFIFCSNQKLHEQWAKDWAKIKGVFTKIAPICEALKAAAAQCEHDAIAISFMATSGDIFKKNLDQLDCSFMYTQILKEILLSITFEHKHIQEYIMYCRNAFIDNNQELNKINKFETTYHNQTPIWWYTCECFLYPMLNRILRTMEVDIIIKMGFFIGDLHRQIEQLHSEQFNGQHSKTIFTVYRGQGLPNAAFEQMTKTKGGLISFNCFLSTSKKRDVSMGFARRAVNNPDSVGILFVMKIDPSVSTTPFASINEVGFFGDKEDEVLFSMHTVFRIRDINPLDETTRLFQVDLTLTSDDDQDLRMLTDHMRKESFPDSEGWERVGLLLLQLGQSDKADHIYQVFLEQATETNDKASIYNQLGWVKCNQGKYKEAIKFFEQSLAIAQQSLSPNYPDLGMSYSNIGEAYRCIGEYSKALLSHESGLAIRQQSLSPNHPDFALSYNNIGNVYGSMGEYSKAISSYEKALAIRRLSLPPNHPDTASS